MKPPLTCGHGMELEDTQVPRAGATTMSEYAMEKWKRQNTWWRDKRESEVERFVQVQWQLWLAWEKTVTERRGSHCSEQSAWFFYLHFYLFILFSLGGGYKSGGQKKREKNGIGVHDVKFSFNKIMLKIKQKQNDRHFHSSILLWVSYRSDEQEDRSWEDYENTHFVLKRRERIFITFMPVYNSLHWQWRMH